MKDPDLYKSAPLEVRRHIWLSDSNLFCQEVRDEIKERCLLQNLQTLNRNGNIDKQAFTDSINEQAVNFKAHFEFLSDPRQRRRRCPFLKKIVEMTRANSTLYNKAIERFV